VADVTGHGRSVDVVVVGFGPVGATLAVLCARRRLDVVVLERDTEVFPLPRAVQIDHEGLRVLQEVGCADEVLAGSILNDGLAFLTSDRRTLLSATVPPLAPTGRPAPGSTSDWVPRSPPSTRMTTGSASDVPMGEPFEPATSSVATGPGR